MEYLILIVDDEPCSRDLKKWHLEEMGYRVIEACDGREGVQAAIRERPRLILMNCLMPELDGIKSTKIILQQPGLEHTPIIMNSVYAEEEMRDEAIAAGCVDYLQEPCCFSELVEKVQAHILIG